MNLENKTPLNQEIIKKMLEYRCGFKENMKIAVFWFVCAAFVFDLFVVSLLSFSLWSIPSAALCSWLIFIAIKRIKKGKANSQKIQNGQYQIITTVCTQISEPRHCETEDGKEYYVCDVSFKNGVTWSLSVDELSEIMFKVGESAYLLYLDASQKPVWVFGYDYYLLEGDSY